MSTPAAAPTTVNEADLLLNQIVNSADLNGLTEQTRIAYYKQVCESVGLNPLTKPFDFYSLSGKIVLYAKRECTDQLRKLHTINIKIVDRTVMDGVYVVTARATMPNGREDESTGAVSLRHPKVYKNKKGEVMNHPKAGQDIDGEDKANAMMKSETKAKRRVTLSIVGLGVLDESEVIDAAAQVSDTEVATVAALPGPAAKSDNSQPAAPAATTTAVAASSQQTPPTSEATAPASTAGPAAAAPSDPAKTNAPPPADAASKKDETGELMPAARIKTFEAKIKSVNMEEVAFITKFGKPLKDMLKSRSAEIQAFIEGK